MRVPRVKISNQDISWKKEIRENKSCLICGNKTCVDQKIIECCIRTRSMTRLMKELSDVIIYETYRCMPLLGDEKQHAPDWDEHIVKYHIVFIKKKLPVIDNLDAKC